MNFVPKIVKDAVPGVDIANDPSALDTFLHDHCAAAILRKQTPDRVQSWLNALEPEQLPRGRVILPPSAVAETLGHLCDIAGLPAGPERNWLEADIDDLAQTFAKLMEARFLRLRLDVITTNACRRFHVDAITARLICTYRGTGTQYGIATDPSGPKDIYTVETGAPILLRGTLWPETPSSGLLHRSPPIEGTGEARLVLVLDKVDDPADEAEHLVGIPADETRH
ncbi:MAG: DUF1826 domain-containing protein [Pseudomonadota bacterium]